MLVEKELRFKGNSYVLELSSYVLHTSSKITTHFRKVK